MQFDLEKWKENVAESLAGWRLRYWRAKPDSIYYWLSAVTLKPLVQAYRLDSISALLTLGSITSSVGAKLIANKIPEWWEASEESIANELKNQVKLVPELGKTLDQVLLKMETLSSAYVKLSISDRNWFKQTFQRDLHKVGSPIDFQSLLFGDGAIAQGDDAFAVGAKGIGIQGDGNSITTIDNLTLTVNPSQNQSRPAQAKKNYFLSLRRNCATLPLATLGWEELAEQDITLEDVYVDLDTTEMVGQKQAEVLRKSAQEHLATIFKIPFDDVGRIINKIPLTDLYNQEIINNVRIEHQLLQKDIQAKTALSAHFATVFSKRAVILGGPGAGKSTFVKKLVGWLAGANIEQDRRPPLGYYVGLVPVLLSLRDFNERLSNIDLSGLSPESLQSRLASQLKDLIFTCLKEFDANEFETELLDTLKTGKFLLVLDGLDEVHQSKRMLVKQIINAFISKYPAERTIITCREKSYSGEIIFAGFDTYRLAKFDAPKIRMFVAVWLKTLDSHTYTNPQNIGIDSEKLVELLTSDDLKELSENPMLLTTICIIFEKHAKPLEARALIYKEAVSILLHKWQKRRFGENDPSLDPELQSILLNEIKIRDTIELLAYEAHRKGADKSHANGDLDRSKALSLLEKQEALGDVGIASKFLDYIDQRAGILEGKGGDTEHPSFYSFPHRTFQEYLAGSYIVNWNKHRERDALNLIRKHAQEGDFWNVAVQLAFEKLYFERDTKMLLDLAYQLCPEHPSADPVHQKLSLWAGDIIQLIGTSEVLVDTDVRGGEKYLFQLQKSLVSILQNADYLDRIRAGELLGSIGDVRFDPEKYHLPNQHIMGFVEIPPGRVTVTQDNNSIEVEVDTFYLNMYPVTVAQYLDFLEKSGYLSPRLNYYHSQPQNCPVTYVSCWDAIAYCEWLDQQLRKDRRRKIYSLLDDGWKIMIPSEAEWQLVAQECSSVGSKIDANTKELGLNRPTPVGCFVPKMNPCGISDVFGNVWEWTMKSHDAGGIGNDVKLHPEETQILKGGSFKIDGIRLSAQSRRKNLPNYSSFDYGFRLALCKIR